MTMWSRTSTSSSLPAGPWNGTGDIVRAGGRISTGMVVDNDHGSSVAPDGVFEQFTHVHLRRIDRTLIDFDDIDQLVAGFEKDDAQVSPALDDIS